MLPPDSARGERLSEMRQPGLATAVQVLVGGEAAQAALHVAARFVQRDLLDERVERQLAACAQPPRHPARSGVVGGERQRWMAEMRVPLAQVAAAQADVNRRDGE